MDDMLEMHDNFVKTIMKDIEANNLLTDRLDEFFKTKILRTTHYEKPTKHRGTVSRNCKLVKEMFKGVVEHKLCLAVAQKMTKLMKEDERLTLEDACRIGAEEMNAKKGYDLFPMTEEAFEALQKGSRSKGCKIVEDTEDTE